MNEPSPGASLLQKAGVALFVILLLLVVIAVSVGLAARNSLDGVPGVFSFILGEDTRYAPGYSDEAFVQVRRGMGPEEVLDLIGDPLQRIAWKDGSETWAYSESPTSTHYRLRRLSFMNGQVVLRTAEFYFD